MYELPDDRSGASRCSIQSAVSAGVMGMDKFSEEVRRGMEEVEQVGSQLSQIIQQVQQMAPRCEAASVSRCIMPPPRRLPGSRCARSVTTVRSLHVTQRTTM